MTYVSAAFENDRVVRGFGFVDCFPVLSVGPLEALFYNFS